MHDVAVGAACAARALRARALERARSSDPAGVIALGNQNKHMQIPAAATSFALHTLDGGGDTRKWWIRAVWFQWSTASGVRERHALRVLALANTIRRLRGGTY